MPLDSSPVSALDEGLLLYLVLGGALWALLPGQESPDPTPCSTPSPLVSEAVTRGHWRAGMVVDGVSAAVCVSCRLVWGVAAGLLGQASTDLGGHSSSCVSSPPVLTHPEVGSFSSPM